MSTMQSIKPDSGRSEAGDRKPAVLRQTRPNLIIPRYTINNTVIRHIDFGATYWQRRCAISREIASAYLPNCISDHIDPRPYDDQHTRRRIPQYKCRTANVKFFVVPSLSQKLYLVVNFWKLFSIAPTDPLAHDLGPQDR